ncbi:hypothetical protein SAMN04487907_1222 [Zunongwangia mangrovi]|uniref:Uncharacterized protein n=1 Tax=Zunongwangia mangrovi TaxID=1334022 RepID=A0A1I1NAV4_9FLAO|nr:hypothetical protein SAMN04487907_1222 [Zunongwangia mangrovi]
MLLVSVVVYYAAFAIYSIIQNVGFYDFLLLVAPSISFLIYTVQNSLSLKRHIESKNETLNQIDHYINKYSKKKKVPKENILRQIQDVIYTERTVPEKIPDWFYYLYKEDNENRTDQIVKSIIASF